MSMFTEEPYFKLMLFKLNITYPPPPPATCCVGTYGILNMNMHDPKWQLIRHLKLTVGDVF